MTAVILYATDHDGWYPDSVATGNLPGNTWCGQDPRTLKAFWQAGEQWNNPKTSYDDPVVGSYCLY